MTMTLLTNSPNSKQYETESRLNRSNSKFQDTDRLAIDETLITVFNFNHWWRPGWHAIAMGTYMQEAETNGSYQKTSKSRT